MLLICYGTRPEYIKVKSLIDCFPNIITLFTGQHITLIGEHKPSRTLTIGQDSDNRMNNIICSILKNNIFDGITHVLVQGDTTSAMAIALSAFNHGIPVIHLEAGLRTYHMHDPFPEEINRQIIARIASIHLCPTENNKLNLINEKIEPSNIFVTGNTGLDNIDRNGTVHENVVVITLHRRDNIPIIKQWFHEINIVANKYPELLFIFPMHPNPEIQLFKNLLDSSNIHITSPIDHTNMINLIKRAKFIITDSGGIQEEASFLGKKIIVCRKTTERPETIGTHTVMCHEPKELMKCIIDINNNYLIDAPCPYGDGNAWCNIKKILMKLNIV